jgi:uncharacterized protein
MEGVRRITENQALSALARAPAVALLGPRQIGKTTLALDLARQMPSVYLDLASPADLAKLAEPELYLATHRDKLVILDEIQRLPSLFLLLRGLIDSARRDGRRNGLYLMLGSASLELSSQASESLAGRIAYLELQGLCVQEMPTQGDNLWIRGGFPESALANSDADSYAWREDFIRSYLERDVAQFAPRVAAESLRRFWSMLAHLQGGLFNASNLSRSLDVDQKTVARYLDLLVDLFLLRRLQPWHQNHGKRLIKSPKIYLRDSGLLHALLGIRNLEQMLGHAAIGASYEGFVIENLLGVAPRSCTPYFYRSAAGAEIDLLLQFAGGETWAVEIKRSLQPKPRRGFFHACADVNPSKRFVVYAGTERYPIRDGIEAISLVDLSAKLANKT